MCIPLTDTCGVFLVQKPGIISLYVGGHSSKYWAHWYQMHCIPAALRHFNQTWDAWCAWCREAPCRLCRHSIVATGLKGQAAGMLIQKANPAWIAFGGSSFQFHKGQPKLLVIARQSMIECHRDLSTRISASLDSEALPPESSACRGNRR